MGQEHAESVQRIGALSLGGGELRDRTQEGTLRTPGT